MNCIFCKIIEGDIPSYTIYENNLVKAFLDINPISEGHLMLVPKKHFVNIEDIDDVYLAAINEATKKILPVLKTKLNCQGLSIMQNNGLGQEIKHFHSHLIPRYENDGFKIENKNEKNLSPEDLCNLLKFE